MIAAPGDVLPTVAGQQGDVLLVGGRARSARLAGATPGFVLAAAETDLI